MSQVNEKEVINQIFKYAVSLRKEGKSKIEIKKALIEKGLDEELAQKVINNLSKYSSNNRSASQEDEGSGMGWLLWIGVLILVNILSAVFGWGFWVY